MKYNEFVSKYASSDQSLTNEQLDLNQNTLDNVDSDVDSDVDSNVDSNVDSSMEENSQRLRQSKVASIDRPFQSSWQFWYHHHKKNWKLAGYQKIVQIKTIGEFWELYNNFDAIGGLFSQHFFIMRNNITPLWEDKQNSKGGAWSFKVNTYDAAELWTRLSGMVLGESLISSDVEKKHSIPPCSINGLSICVKKENVTIIKIWNCSSKFKSVKYLPSGLTKRYNVIYKEHCPEW